MIQPLDWPPADLALARAIEERCAVGVRAALEAGALPDGERAGPGDTPPIARAIALNFAPGLLLLLEAGANPQTARGLSRSLSPLHFACQRPDPAMALALLRFGARVDALCPSGAQPLAHSAGSSPCLALARALIEAGADPAHADLLGATALHRCALRKPPGAERENLLVAQLFIQAGADPKAPDLSGHSPLDQALAFGNLAFARFIESRIERSELESNLGRSCAPCAAARL